MRKENPWPSNTDAGKCFVLSQRKEFAMTENLAGRIARQMLDMVGLYVVGDDGNYHAPSNYMTPEQWTALVIGLEEAALATPSPQALAEQCNAFSTTSAREQSVATASNDPSVGSFTEQYAEPFIMLGRATDLLERAKEAMECDPEADTVGGDCWIWLKQAELWLEEVRKLTVTDMIAGQAKLEGVEPAGSGATPECDHGNATSASIDTCRMTPECRDRNPLYCSACGSCEYEGHDKTCPDPREFTVKRGGSPRKVGEEAPFAYVCPANCGCMWRDNGDFTMSLFGKNSESCPACEPLGLAELIPVYARPSSAPVGEQKQEEQR